MAASIDLTAMVPEGLSCASLRDATWRSVHKFSPSLGFIHGGESATIRIVVVVMVLIILVPTEVPA